MAWLFSKRCKQSLKDKKIIVTIPRSVRTRIYCALQDFNQCEHMVSDTNYYYDVYTLGELPNKLKSELGIEDLYAWSNNQGGTQVKTDIEGFILRGIYPPHLFDAIELFYSNITPDSAVLFQKRINEIMDENNLNWRMMDGEIFPVDSTYIEEAILRKSNDLLHEAKFHGAIEEFRKAREDLANNDCKGAIQNANLAVESAMKCILGIDQAKPGELVRKIIDSGIIPEYYSGFLKAFEENILRSVAIMRNEELGAGHGQGVKVNEIPKELAELAVHLSGVIIFYLVQKYLGKLPPRINEIPDTIESADDVPF